MIVIYLDICFVNPSWQTPHEWFSYRNMNKKLFQCLIQVSRLLWASCFISALYIVTLKVIESFLRYFYLQFTKKKKKGILANILHLTYQKLCFVEIVFCVNMKVILFKWCCDKSFIMLCYQFICSYYTRNTYKIFYNLFIFNVAA